MSYITVAKQIVTFESQNEALSFIHDAVNFITNNYKNKVAYTFKNQDYNSNIELLFLILNIIDKMKLKSSSISSITSVI